MSILFDILQQHTSASVVALLGVAYAAIKYRRLQAWAGLLIGGVSTLGFILMTLLVGGGTAVAAGWLDPAAVIEDVTSWGETLWSAVGDVVVDAIKGVLPT